MFNNNSSYALVSEPSITSFTPEEKETNALRVSFDSNINSTDYSYELHIINNNTEKNISGSNKFYVLQNLSPDTEYKVELRTCSADGYSCSNWVTATATNGGSSSLDPSSDQTESTTSPVTEPPVTENKQLATPVLKAVPKYNNKIVLSWNAISGANGYEIYRSGKLLKSVTSSSSTDTGLKSNTNYTYKIRAYYILDGKRIYSSFSAESKVKSKYKSIKILMVDNKRVKKAFESIGGCSVTIV